MLLCVVKMNYSVKKKIVVFCKGEVINEKDRCNSCLGKKVVQESKSLEVHVDKGMKDSQKITLSGQGDQLVRVTREASF